MGHHDTGLLPLPLFLSTKGRPEMQYVVIGRDDETPGTLEKRLAVRQEHLKLGDDLARGGHLITRVLLLDEHETMQGSLLIFDFPDRTYLDNWLKIEPYVISGVWRKIEIIPCRVGLPINFA